jgi:hypothetical protein
MKNAVFWDRETHFLPHRKHVTSPLNSPAVYVIFEGFKTVTMTKAVFRDVTPCSSCKNRPFGETYRLHHQGDKNRSAKKNVSNGCQTERVGSYKRRVA